MPLPQAIPHPLKKEIKKKSIRLWQVRHFIENRATEGQLSRMLNGIVPMPDDIETIIKRRIKQL